MSDELKDTLEAAKEEVKSTISSRFNSPFLGAFIVSWLAWNHRLIFVLFSSMTVDQRFHYIDERLYPTLTAFLLLNVGGPLLSALTYIFVMPWPTEWVHRWNLTRKSRLRNAELRAEGERLLSERESSELRAKMSALKETLAQERDSLARAGRNVLALRVKLSDRFDTKERNLIFERYLKSQPFEVDGETHRHFSSPWIFGPKGELVATMPGNLYWNFDANGLSIFDADASLDSRPSKVASFTFDQDRNLFVGHFEHHGALSLKGQHSSGIFEK